MICCKIRTDKRKKETERGSLEKKNKFHNKTLSTECVAGPKDLFVICFIFFFSSRKYVYRCQCINLFIFCRESSMVQYFQQICPNQMNRIWSIDS